jgi:hypothetical protein
VLPQSNRRESWQQFQAVLGVSELPELVRPYAVNLTITILVLSTLVVPVWYGALHPARFGLWMLLGVIVASTVGWGTARVTRPVRTKFKVGYQDVRDLARFLVAKSPQLLVQSGTGKWTDEEISYVLRELIIKQLGLTEFNDDSRFVEDLRVD